MSKAKYADELKILADEYNTIEINTIKDNLRKTAIVGKYSYILNTKKYDIKALDTIVDYFEDEGFDIESVDNDNFTIKWDGY